MGKKITLEKFLKFFFRLQISKKKEGVRLQVPWSSSQYTHLLPKNTILFLELPFYFPEVPFCFLELLFHFAEVPIPLKCSIF